MRNLMAKVKPFLRDERGITVVEYAIGAGLIGAAVVAALTALGISIGGIILTLVAFLTP